MQLLDEGARRAEAGSRFEGLPPWARERVLRRLLPTFPVPTAESSWRRRTRLTSRNISIVRDAVLSPERLRFRLFVVEELLFLYYTTSAGWAVVGYREYPGHTRYESEAGVVVDFEVEGEDVFIKLSDATWEKLQVETLELDGQERVTVVTKFGRQRATFSRRAHYSFCQLLEETRGGFLLRVGDRRYEVFHRDP